MSFLSALRAIPPLTDLTVYTKEGIVYRGKLLSVAIVSIWLEDKWTGADRFVALERIETWNLGE